MGLYEATGDLRFAYDCYRRFIQMFGNVVLDIAHDEFENAFSDLKTQEGVTPVSYTHLDVYKRQLR